VIGLVLLSGSIRRDSLNAAAIRTMQQVASRLDLPVRMRVLPIRALPFYDEDVDQAGATAEVGMLRSAVAAADALVITTPSYNGAPPGVLTNALEWLSQPYRDSALTGKIAATLSVSPGRLGGVDAQRTLRSILEHCDAVLAGDGPVAIGRAADRPIAGGLFTGPDVHASLSGLLDAVIAAVHGAVDDARMVRAPRIAR
jgi:chromate reductase